MKSLANGFKVWFAQELVESFCAMVRWVPGWSRGPRYWSLGVADSRTRMMSYGQQYLGYIIITWLLYSYARNALLRKLTANDGQLQPSLLSTIFANMELVSWVPRQCNWNLLTKVSTNLRSSSSIKWVVSDGLRSARHRPGIQFCLPKVPCVHVVSITSCDADTLWSNAVH